MTLLLLQLKPSPDRISSMTISLTNITTFPFTINLYHEIYCKAGGPCNCVKKTFAHFIYPTMKLGEPMPAGEKTIEYDTKLQPASLDIPAKSTVEGLHKAVLEIPQVKAALYPRNPKFKILRLTEDSNGKKTVASSAPEELVDAPVTSNDVKSPEKKEPRSRGRRSSSKTRR